MCIVEHHLKNFLRSSHGFCLCLFLLSAVTVMLYSLIIYVFILGNLDILLLDYFGLAFNLIVSDADVDIGKKAYIFYHFG